MGFGLFGLLVYSIWQALVSFLRAEPFTSESGKKRGLEVARGAGKHVDAAGGGCHVGTHALLLLPYPPPNTHMCGRPWRRVAERARICFTTLEKVFPQWPQDDW